MVQPVSTILILIGLGFRLFSPIDYRLNPSSFIHLRSYASRVLFLPSSHPSISSCCFDIRPRQSLFFVLGPLGCAVYPMLTVGLTCTQLSRPFSSWVCHVSDARGGCNVYPRFAFLFISPSCYFPAKFNVSISFAVAFCNLEPRRPFLSIGYRHRLRLRSCQCLYGFAIVLPILHQIPVVVRSLDLWLLFGFSVSSLSRLRLRYLFCSLIICSGATWFYLRITVIPISAFLSSLSISGVLAAQPALSFLASVFSTVVLLSTLLSFHLD